MLIENNISLLKGIDGIGQMDIKGWIRCDLAKGRYYR